MEPLFEAQLGGWTYLVTFSEERYVFTPEGEGTSFSLARTHDEWEGEVPGGLRNDAVAALDNYLLQQH